MTAAYIGSKQVNMMGEIADRRVKRFSAGVCTCEVLVRGVHYNHDVALHTISTLLGRLSGWFTILPKHVIST